MRTREEVWREIFREGEVKQRGFGEQKVIIELLLDIRDQLNDLNHVNGLREHNVPKS